MPIHESLRGANGPLWGAIFFAASSLIWLALAFSSPDEMKSAGFLIGNFPLVMPLLLVSRWTGVGLDLTMLASPAFVVVTGIAGWAMVGCAFGFALSGLFGMDIKVASWLLWATRGFLLVVSGPVVSILLGGLDLPRRTPFAVIIPVSIWILAVACFSVSGGHLLQLLFRGFRKGSFTGS